MPDFHDEALLMLKPVLPKVLDYEQQMKLNLPGIIQYIIGNEYSGTVALDASQAGNNGFWQGNPARRVADPPGPSMGSKVARFDAVNDTIGLYSAQLASQFNPLLGSWGIWLQVFNVGVWTDGAARDNSYGADVNNYILFRKGTNLIQYQFRVGASNQMSINVATSTTNWYHMCITWDKANNRIRGYLNGVAIAGSPTTYPGTWVGSLATGPTRIGGGFFAGFWNGYLCHSILSNQEWTPAQVLLAATAF